jgi:electron transport complex protein RnfG
MSKDKKESLFRPVIILFLICLVTIALLSLTYGFTLDARESQADAVNNADRQSLFPEAAKFTAIKKPDIGLFAGLTRAYQAKSAGGNILGYVISAQSRGYGGDVPVMVAFGPDFKILRMKVLTNSETPGIGKKVEDESFLKQFIGLGTQMDLSVKPDDSGKYIIDAISGATFSSRGVTEAVNIAIRFIREINLEVK